MPTEIKYREEPPRVDGSFFRGLLIGTILVVPVWALIFILLDNWVF